MNSGPVSREIMFSLILAYYKGVFQIIVYASSLSSSKVIITFVI